ncbi:MAG TPA: GAF domain-containing sensor histidine kinase [Kiritimatiellia bacterium]|nr:GAF domain-containing sensor histidine kinase [Kiritimatiellia bacterium]
MEKELSSDNTGPIYEALMRISLALNSQLDLSDVLNQVIYYTRLLTGAHNASIVLWNAKKKMFERGASTTEVGDTVAVRVRRTSGATRWIIDHAKPFVVPDTAHDPFIANRMLPENSIRAYAGVPITRESEVLGVLYALSYQNRQFDLDELKWMQELAGLAAIAISNARMLKSLQELSAFKDAMRRMAAHDLRQPLSIATLYLEMAMIERGTLSDEQFSSLQTAAEALNRMETMIKDLLDYERLTAEGDVVRQPVNLNDIVVQAVSNFAAHAAQKSQQLKTETAPRAPIVNGDPVLLLEAVGNLIANAVKYTQNGGRILVSLSSDEESETLSVRDNGPGISPSDMQNLFQPFRRRKEKGKDHGTGLGLSLVKVITEQHGGEVSAESTPGQGSTFSIHIPREAGLIRNRAGGPA